jgi:integrase/recombinase XerC
LSDEEEDALVAAVNATGTLRDQTIITLLLHTSLRAQELCTLTRQQIHLGKRNGTLRIMGKRKKVREVPLNMTARSSLNQYLETLSPECQYLFPSEKTHRALTGRALGHLVTKYAIQAQVTDLSPHDLRHRFGYRMAEVVPLHRLAQIMGHDSLDTTMLYVRGTKHDLQQDVEKIAWI